MQASQVSKNSSLLEKPFARIMFGRFVHGMHVVKTRACHGRFVLQPSCSNSCVAPLRFGAAFASMARAHCEKPAALPKLSWEYVFTTAARWRHQSFKDIKEQIHAMSPEAWCKCESLEDAVDQADLLWAIHAFEPQTLDEIEQLTIYVAGPPHPEWNFVLRKIPSAILVLSCALEIVDGSQEVEMQLTYSMSCTGKFIQCWWVDIKKTLTMQTVSELGLHTAIDQGWLKSCNQRTIVLIDQCSHQCSRTPLCGTATTCSFPMKEKSRRQRPNKNSHV